MVRRKYPQQPDSFDPADWYMHCDLLQDSDAPPRLWRRSKRIADALTGDPRLYLLAHRAFTIPRTVCEPDRAAGNYRRWFCSRPVFIRQEDIGFVRLESTPPNGPNEPDFLAAWVPGLEHCLVTPQTALKRGGGVSRLWGYARNVWGESRMRLEFFYVLGLSRMQAEFDIRRRWFCVKEVQL
jgi:hypothetical protein